MRPMVVRAMRHMDGEKTVRELAALAHCTYNTLAVWLNKEHRLGSIHIASWRRTGRRFSRCYAVGAGDDAPKPPSMSGTERFHRFLERMTAYERDVYLERQRTIRRKVKSDPLVRAFFGGKR